MKYDIKNDMTCDRVVHDANKAPMMIKRGTVREGVDLLDTEADRLIKLRRKLGDGKELQLTRSAQQDEPTVKTGKAA